MRRPCPHCGAQNILERTICHECRRPLPTIPSPAPVLSEIPMTEAVRACLAAVSARYTLYTKIALAVIGIGVLVLAIAEAFRNLYPGDAGEIITYCCGPMPVGVGLVAALYCAIKAGAARWDSGQSSYCRATGRVTFHVGQALFHDMSVRVGKSGDVACWEPAEYLRMRRQLEGLPGTIEYVKRTKLLLEVRDADDQLLYRYSGYRSDGVAAADGSPRA